jgi:hypothetical protein
MHPDRTVALVVHGSNARTAWAPDYPWGLKKEDLDAFVASIERAWGTEAFVREHFSDLVGDDAIIRWIATLSRYAMSPGAAAAYERMVYEDDVREILSAIHVPTLILHREHDGAEHNRYLAEHIPEAQYLPLAGEEHIPYLSDQDTVTAAIALRAERAGRGGQPRPHTRHDPVHRHRRLDRDGSPTRRPWLGRRGRASMQQFAGSSLATGAQKSTQRATASLRRSTARHGRRSVRRPS